QEELQVLREHLSHKRLKQTQQRESILKVFLQAKRHLTVEELHDLVRKQNRSIGLTTIYRTMKLFCECNLARANHFEEGRVRYEQQFKTAHHDHMICLECGETLEFVNQQIERLQEKAAAQFGFEMINHRMEIFGYCKRCKKNTKTRRHEL
ncbi:MAG TPA: transcriptional repressor, partial [Acidobacteriota bacterium]